MPIFIALFIAAILFSINPAMRLINRKRAEAKERKEKKEKEEYTPPRSMKLQQKVAEIQGKSIPYDEARERYDREQRKSAFAAIDIYGLSKSAIGAPSSEIYSLKMEIVDLKKKINYDENLRGMIHDLDTGNVRLKLEVQSLENKNKETTKLWESSTTDNINLRDEIEKLNNAIAQYESERHGRVEVLEAENKKLYNKIGKLISKPSDIETDCTFCDNGHELIPLSWCRKCRRSRQDPPKQDIKENKQ